MTADDAHERGRSWPQTNKIGHITQVIGAVVDVQFDGHLPAILNALETENQRQPPGARSGAASRRITVRTIAMDTTEGLVRGQEVTDTGAADLGAGRRRHARPHHQRDRRAGGRGRPGQADERARRSTSEAPAFTDQSTEAQILVTGIKVVDLLAPYARGGKIGLFGGAGVGKTVIIRS